MSSHEVTPGRLGLPSLAEQRADGKRPFELADSYAPGRWSGKLGKRRSSASRSAVTACRSAFVAGGAGCFEASALLACLALLAGCGADDGQPASGRFPYHPAREISSPAAFETLDRKNLILISLDTLRADHLSAYGYERPTSPNIDRLAQEGVVFERAFSQSSHTAQSHMSLFTGLYPPEHGVENTEDTGGVRLNARIPTLAEILAAAGYRTRAITGGGNVAGFLGFDRGFESYESPGQGRAEAVFALAAEKLRELAAGEATPFFLFVHTYEIHDPYVSPEEHRRLFTDPAYTGRMIGSRTELDRLSGGGYYRGHQIYWERVDRDSREDRRHLVGLYDAGIHLTDLHLGSFLDAIDGLQLRADTLVVLLSDHGEEFGEHGRFTHHQLYDELLHVPLVFRLPDPAAPRGQRFSGPVRLIDVLPTVLDVLGLTTPSHVQGSSLLPLIRGVEESPRPVFAQLGGLSSLRIGRWKLLEREPSVTTRTWKIGSWQLTLQRTRDRGELYDVESDPRELDDLARRHGRRTRAMREELSGALASFNAMGDRYPPRPEAEVDEETREQLEALGYLDR